MAAEKKAKSVASTNDTSIAGKKRKQRYLPHNKPVKKKGHYPLHPGVQGFFITCDGGRERQASHEALNVIDSFFEELVCGKDSGFKLGELADKPLNKKIKFSDSESCSSDDEEEEEEKEGEEDKDVGVHEEESKFESHKEQNDSHKENETTDVADPHEGDIAATENEMKEKSNDDEKNTKSLEIQASEVEEPPNKKPCVEADASKRVIQEKAEKSVDQLIEAELAELGDKNKRRFFNLDSGCNGVVFIQMRKRDGEPGPIDVVQHMMTSVASTRKHISRFILRVLPIEVACYASVEDISRAIKPLIAENFPVESQSPIKFAVLYEARANSGIDRTTIINTVAKSVPDPHKVDLNNPEKTIVVEIVKTICLIGVVERYRELSKYNLRQLTSAK